ncbi:type IV toxin-antitoxin system AbiEi family antitoxin domain-containing protein [Maridesulfovibrio sp.]|uniref:type IV toxin-antitoxin system AbiEi family antitoxin domain-containing protein n=1 Tax=Maridesulfovibrio sp. TaxID=2795000 RepID=UPI002A18DBE6|nr:type IV toxin-antitoxin system AbiEi family antitoxin domain-containing protein [Maridesulfovibrio sp.]
MDQRRGTKINQLMLAWPNGTIKNSEELAKLEINKSLVQGYMEQGWLVSVGRGAYAKSHDTPTWLGGLHSLQQKDKPFIHAGGRTALELQGYTHYVSAQKREIFLFAPPKTKLAAWFAKYDWGQTIVFTSTSLFPDNLSDSFTEHDAGTFTVKISSPERAILELLHHVLQKVGFDEAFQLMQGLGTLRPTLVQTLLEECNSIKVKRLFLYLARESGHRWLSRIKRDSIQLGSGKREIVKNGMLDKEFNITVPKHNEEELF